MIGTALHEGHVILINLSGGLPAVIRGLGIFMIHLELLQMAESQNLGIYFLLSWRFLHFAPQGEQLAPFFVRISAD